MAQPTLRYILKWSERITPKVMHLGFTREDNEPLPFKAGQFITLHIESPNDNSKILHRSYSIANIPGKDNTVEIACSYVEGGIATQFLFNLKPGDVINASGPYGLFILKEEMPARYVMVATGTGVTPYRSMLEELQKKFKDTPTLEAHVLLGVRNQEELLFAKDFVQFAENHSNFKFWVCYSREADKSDADLKSFERKGHVQDVFPILNLNPQSDLIYLCGNPNMIDDAFNSLTGMGFDRKSIRREKYLFAH